MSEWIKTSERLPEEDVYVLWYDGKRQFVKELSGWDRFRNDLVGTHWMPLPEPPTV